MTTIFKCRINEIFNKFSLKKKKINPQVFSLCFKRGKITLTWKHLRHIKACLSKSKFFPNTTNYQQVLFIPKRNFSIMMTLHEQTSRKQSSDENYFVPWNSPQTFVNILSFYNVLWLLGFKKTAKNRPWATNIKPDLSTLFWLNRLSFQWKPNVPKILSLKLYNTETD